ncbi:Xre family transcriptional regulator [Rhodovulum imhoffii]|uniref:Xre family transcriptional regulator n=1 Tax=Rhodovulum imhoffii TaxID=365340 RepID=A0A2T5BW65_9RHOB|nr:helix-turn-helix domain-containing protein [Rhodovulum imhoffii]MBK5935137.1 transcriptional regulator [Rhodovulum imhoffii]PTN03896.1 Xre family transcriptional regulator [Rhodovulum imhoffii]
MSEDISAGGGWYSNDTATFGDRLAGAREAVGMTQSELAKRLGVKLKTIRNWEEDLSEPRANRLQTLAGVMNVSIMWLLSGRGEGLDGPAEEVVLSPDLRETLSDIRQVKSEIGQLADRLGVLEKRLRHALKEHGE